MKKKWIFLGSIIIFTCFAAALAGPLMSDVEQPKYELLSSEKHIEIRQYAPLIIAQVTVQGQREEAISAGFRKLADYIFGNNTARQNIEMTAPVTQETNQKIAMTAPVQQQLDGDSWTVSFVMPSDYTIETLPLPNNAAVTLKEIPGKKYIVSRFSGSITDQNIADHEKELLDYIEKNKIEVLGTPKYAFYNPPWTLPFLRRNEIMLEVK